MPETFHCAYPKHRNSDRLKNPSHEAHTHSGPPAGFPVFHPAPSLPVQKIHSCSVTLKDNKLKVLAASKEDLTLEIWTFDDKSTFFEEVFGIEPILERVNK